ncbi:GntR family transcriptional regulator [Bacillus sp. FSL K6-3431]|uniref:GntR family transcriptional regulator n=1 Tax=Bacillus sp. FSL K6-3431 TaxID=2921500 RepID=UPI0030F7D01D
MNVPLYKQIYKNVLNQIIRGELKKGQKIPSEKDLAKQFDVSRITSKKALDLLAQNKIIERVQGKGSFVIYSNETTITTSNSDLGNAEIKILKIGLVITDISDSYGTELIKVVESNVGIYGAQLLIKFTHEMIENEEKAITELLQVGVDGMIVLPIHGELYNPKILELVLQKFPIVLVDRYLRGIPASSVSTNNMQAAREATDYLISLGHQHIAYITLPYDGTTVLEDRMKGYQLAHTKRKLPLNPDYLFTNNASEVAYKPTKSEELNKELAKIKKFIMDNPDITAFFVCRYSFGEILAHVIHSMNKRVPEDYSIICFDSPPSVFAKPRFTHVHQKEDKLGEKAVQILMAQILGERDILTEFMDFDLVEGLSTASIKLEMKN